MNQRRLRMYRDDELLFDDEWIPEDDAVPNAEELRQCFRRWWRWPAKTAVVVLLLSWWCGDEMDYYPSAKGDPAMVAGFSPPAFASAARSPVMPTVSTRGRGVEAGR